ncbi:hypothetical protein DFJ77DRAFT_520824 [Powellomyces hirtus]|nr:hypothetical protein DFJ77DRAFT_520824 [Powellomyces hirtus]
MSTSDCAANPTVQELILTAFFSNATAVGALCTRPEVVAGLMSSPAVQAAIAANPEIQAAFMNDPAVQAGVAVTVRKYVDIVATSYGAPAIIIGIAITLSIIGNPFLTEISNIHPRRETTQPRVLALPLLLSRTARSRVGYGGRDCRFWIAVLGYMEILLTGAAHCLRVISPSRLEAIETTVSLLRDASLVIAAGYRYAAVYTNPAHQRLTFLIITIMSIASTAGGLTFGITDCLKFESVSKEFWAVAILNPVIYLIPGIATFTYRLRRAQRLMKKRMVTKLAHLETANNVIMGVTITSAIVAIVIVQIFDGKSPHPPFIAQIHPNPYLFRPLVKVNYYVVPTQMLAAVIWTVGENAFEVLTTVREAMSNAKVSNPPSWVHFTNIKTTEDDSHGGPVVPSLDRKPRIAKPKIRGEEEEEEKGEAV